MLPSANIIKMKPWGHWQQQYTCRGCWLCPRHSWSWMEYGMLVSVYQKAAAHCAGRLYTCCSMSLACRAEAVIIFCTYGSSTDVSCKTSFFLGVLVEQKASLKLNPLWVEMTLFGTFSISVCTANLKVCKVVLRSGSLFLCCHITLNLLIALY